VEVSGEEQLLINISENCALRYFADSIISATVMTSAIATRAPEILKPGFINPPGK